ncbi:MAG TPA: 3-phosphoshikimate 1-carboxyvinyltransferase [Gemmatimonadaceae bacterium]
MKVHGSLRVPGDKSISHRSLILGAIADGESRIEGILQSADVHSTAGVLRALGARIPELADTLSVRGVGLRGLSQPLAALDCGNSGTTTRLMAGVVAGLPVHATFVGDSSLSRRPMRRVARPLEAMGARVDLPEHGGLPMTIHGGHLHGVKWASEHASAQVKSAILLAALVAGVHAEVVEPVRTRDHTERMLAARGVRLTIEAERIAIDPTSRVDAAHVVVPGDPSSAAFFAGLASIADEGSLTMENVCVNETRTGFFRQLRLAGVDVRERNRRVEGGEPVADLIVSPGELHGTVVDGARVPSMVDELPLLACIATRANGETLITGAGELRVKESDRITAVVDNLRAIGAEADELPDGMRIRGSERPLEGRVRTHGDHRLAMAFGILAAAQGNSIAIDDRDCVAVSYPNFWADLERVLA